MDKVRDQSRRVSHLYPPIGPFDQRMLDVGDGHRIYVEQCGRPDGIPVVVLHGGPGGGCSPAMRRYFDPDLYRIILFDQRGCGLSRPNGSVEANTTWHLVADLELIRTTFGIDRWMVFGGSWGATLGLIYAQAYPSHVRALILRGVFLMTRPELDWFYGGGAGRFWPELWKRFRDAIPDGEREDLIAAYHKRLFSGDRPSETGFARIWANWENALASIDSEGHWSNSQTDYARTFARLENHYFTNQGFLAPDQAILKNMDRIAHIPGVIIQGRFDMICPPESAYRLAENWPGARLEMVGKAGHALSEKGISEALVHAMDELATL